jgi:hypothetical protein
MLKQALIAVLALAAAPATLAQDAGKWSAGAGIGYTSGDYGTTETTSILSVPFTLRYEHERWTFKGTLPWYSISGSSAVVPELGAADRGNRRGGGAATSSTSGFGDATASATYTAFYDARSKLGIDVTGKVKLPTGEADKGLSSGSTDFTFGGDLYKTIDRTTWFGGLSYTTFGSSSLQLDNAVGYSVGASYRLDSRDSIGLSLDGRTRVSAATAAQRELIGYWSRAFDSRWKLHTYGLVGLANGSPDFGLGASVLRAF